MIILHSESSAAWGGQENRTSLECLGMQGRGHEVTILVQPESRLYLKLKNKGIRVYPLAMRSCFDLKAIIRARDILKKERIQIVHTHSSIDSWVVGLAARWYGKALILRTRHVATAVGSTFPYRYLCHRLITTGENIRRIFIDKYTLDEDRVISIPTGVDLKTFSLEVSGEKLRQELGLGKEIPLLGHVGIFRGKKGHRYFLEACAAIKNEFPRARFLIVGEGPIEKHIREWIKELGLEREVVLTGFREDINEVLASLDILVMSSVDEGVPQVISQALAMGKAVVATSIGGIPELIKDGSTGLLVPPGDSDYIAQACRRLLRDKPLAIHLGQAGRKLVEEKFSLAAMLDKIEEIYRGSLKNT